MICFLQTYQGSFIPWVILIFVAISLLSNIVKKLSQSGPKPPTGPPGTLPPRRRFMDLIEQVRRMAEDGEEKPPAPTRPEKPPAFFSQPRQGPQQQPRVRTPVVPRLKPVGQVRRPPGREPTKRLVIGEDEIRIRAEREKAEQRTRELRERGRREREQRRKPGERVRISGKKKTDLGAELRKRYEKPVEVIPTAPAPKAVDFSSLFESRETLRDAIVLREILGLPRAMRRHTSRQR